MFIIICILFIIICILFIIIVLSIEANGTSFFFHASFTAFHTLFSLLNFFCYFVLFHSCFSHARVFGKTLMHEFLIFYPHTEQYLLFSYSATTNAQCVFGAKKQKYLCTSKPIPVNYTCPCYSCRESRCMYGLVWVT